MRECSLCIWADVAICGAGVEAQRPQLLLHPLVEVDVRTREACWMLSGCAFSERNDGSSVPPRRKTPRRNPSVERISGMARLLCNGGAVCRDRGADILKPRAYRIEDDHLVI